MPSSSFRSLARLFHFSSSTFIIGLICSCERRPAFARRSTSIRLPSLSPPTRHRRRRRLNAVALSLVLPPSYGLLTSSTETDLRRYGVPVPGWRVSVPCYL